MSRLRRGEISVSMAPPPVEEVLDLCATAHELSDGWFDPWALPGGVDPTGYVKGWAAQRALADLEDPAVAGAIVNAAGDIASSVVSVGPSGSASVSPTLSQPARFSAW